MSSVVVGPAASVRRRAFHVALIMSRKRFGVTLKRDGVKVALNNWGFVTLFNLLYGLNAEIQLSI